MKITGINPTYSDGKKVALYTQPRPDSRFIAESSRLLKTPPPALKNIHVSFTSDGLIVYTSQFSPEIANAVEQVIAATEEALRLADANAQQQKDAAEAAKKSAMESASKAFGVNLQ